MFNIRFCVFLLATLATTSAMATCPLLDLMVYNGKDYPLAGYTKPPRNQKIDEWVSALPSCSAPGQGRAIYEIDGKTIFLVKFRSCSSELNVSDAYGTTELKIPAKWLDGKFDVALGSCHGGWDPAKESFIVKEGALVEFLKTP